MKPVRGLSLACMSLEALRDQSAKWWDEVLGVAAIGASELPFVPAGVPCARVLTPPLGGTPDFCEVWRSVGTVTAGRRGAISFRHDGSLLFGSLALAEADWTEEEAGEGTSALQRLTDAAYREIFALLDESGYRHLFRVWNYFPRINDEERGSERYWQFNAGRQAAFLGSGRSASGEVPAACALGSTTGALTLYFLARREPPLAVENPRQVSAYDYPACYGPRSPTFARASVAMEPAGAILFVSGTASILGHRTMHAGDVVAQAEESVRNIEAVLAEQRRVLPGVGFDLADLFLKVYVRHPADVRAVREVLTRQLGPDARRVFVQADVCRSDLLVEIEASAGHAMEIRI